MAGTAGKKARVLVCATNNGAFNAIGGIKSISHEIDGTNIDDSEMGVDYMQRIQGLKDGKISLSGNRRLADVNGQNFVLSALLNDTPIFAKVLPDNGATANVGFLQEVKVTKFGSDAQVDGNNGISIELEGSGAITLV